MEGNSRSRVVWILVNRVKAVQMNYSFITRIKCEKCQILVSQQYFQFFGTRRHAHSYIDSWKPNLSEYISLLNSLFEGLFLKKKSPSLICWDLTISISKLTSTSSPRFANNWARTSIPRSGCWWIIIFLLLLFSIRTITDYKNTLLKNLIYENL